MNTRSYWLCTLVVGIIAVAVLGWAIRSGEPAVAVVTLVLATGALYLCRTRVHEVLEDERSRRIDERAAKRALEAFTFTGIICAVFLYALSTPETDLTGEGLTLGLAVTALLLLYAGFQTYYSRLPGAPR